MRFGLEHSIIEYIESAVRNSLVRPLLLGGTAASGGGTGTPPGGFIGYLPQTRVAYDLSEVASSGTPGSGYSLLDNLNHIRYRVTVLEDETLIVQENDVIIASGINILNFEGNASVVDEGSGKVTVVISGVASSGGSGHVIEDLDEEFIQRSKLQFLGGVTVLDDAINDRTVVTISGGSGSSAYYINRILDDNLIIPSGSNMILYDYLDLNGYNLTFEGDADLYIFGGIHGDYVVEAPSNGTPYARQDAGWVSLPGGGDMLKATYDSNDDGIVDEADYASDAGNAATANEAADVDIDSLAEIGSVTSGDVFIIRRSGVSKKLNSDNLPTASGVTTFSGLLDTPSTYIGNSLKYPRVNIGETALEFVTISGGGSTPPQFNHGFHRHSLVTVGNALAPASAGGGSEMYVPWRQNASDNGDTFKTVFYIAAGTYTLYITGYTWGNSGKLDVYMDDVLIQAGIDWYSAALTDFVTKTVSSVNVTTDGEHVFKFVVNGKNVASGGYNIDLYEIYIRQASY